jgi:hypothetical protein
VYTAADFQLGLIGNEVSGQTNAATIARQLTHAPQDRIPDPQRRSAALPARDRVTNPNPSHPATCSRLGIAEVCVSEYFEFVS